MKSILSAITAWLLLTAASASHASDKITIMVGGIEKHIYLPAKLAEQLGYLRETGLDVELLSEPTGVNAETELLSGAAQGVIGFYDHTIDLQARGKLAQSVVQFSHTPGEAILVSRAASGHIKSPADFKGRRLGVTGLGSSTNFLTLYLAAKAGIKSTEFSTLPVGAGATFIAAMGQGKIEAGMTTEPTISRLVHTGAASILVDLRSPKETEKALGGTYPAACLYMESAWVNTHKPQVQKLANAFVKTLRYIRSHSAKEIADRMPADYYASDKKMYIEALENSKVMFTDDGVMPANGPATVLGVLNAFDKSVQGKSINLANTYTTEFVKAAK
ncbi:ABC transporter substrate-binding protein [Duganella sp. Dugasp56]|uniref:ABC transporter substrate-binding protein n=1 Tax=Duganella sp. Dugasp56 TaxID=3243046 RepID=UPI0039AF3635